MHESLAIIAEAYYNVVVLRGVSGIVCVFVAPSSDALVIRDASSSVAGPRSWAGVVRVGIHGLLRQHGTLVGLGYSGRTACVVGMCMRVDDSCAGCAPRRVCVCGQSIFVRYRVRSAFEVAGL